jgi:hypothetical protein
MILHVGGPWRNWSVYSIFFSSMHKMRRFHMDLFDEMASHGDGDGRSRGGLLVSRLFARSDHLAY